MNAIIDDDFWQVVKHEKLQEVDFEVESLISFGGSHWCRSTSDFEHRSTDFNQPIDSLSRASIDETYRVDCIVQCREDHDSRGVRSKTPKSTHPCLCQHRSANRASHRSTTRDHHRSTNSSTHRSTSTSHIPSGVSKDRHRPNQ